MTAKKPTSTESDLRETIENLGEITRGQLRDFEDHFRRARKFVEKNPVVAVAGVFVLGWIVGQIWRSRERVIYVERSKP